MGIKNYTTSIKAEKSVSEIQKILGKGGASSVSIDFEANQPSAVRFSLKVGNEELWFRLPSNPQGILSTMKRDGVRGSYRNMEQARNVSWRIIKDWLDAQMAIIDAGQAKATEVFLSYLLQPSGETIYQKFENQQLKLGAG